MNFPQQEKENKCKQLKLTFVINILHEVSSQLISWLYDPDTDQNAIPSAGPKHSMVTVAIQPVCQQ